MEDIIKSALSLRKNGLFTSAFNMLNTCEKDRDIKATLNVWKRELLSYSWNMARKDKERTSSNPQFGELTGITEVWKTRINFKIPPGRLPNIPSPIMADDVLITPDASLNSFIGVMTNNGEIIRGELFLPELLSYASTPVYLSPFILFAINGSIFKLSISNTILINSIFNDIRIKPVDWSCPLVFSDKAIFAFSDTILIYGDYPEFIETKLKKDDDFLRSPVVFNQTPIFLSKYGEIQAIKQGRMEILKEPFDDIICGSPCLFKNKLYFEGVSLSTSTRNIFAYDVLKNELIMETLPDEICLSSHIHLNFPPLVFKDGIIISSDIGSRLYYITASEKMVILPVEIRLKGVHQFSSIFSSILGNFIISKSSNGFFYFNIASSYSRVEVFRDKTDIIAQPILRGDRVFFLTTDGIRGFRVS